MNKFDSKIFRSHYGRTYFRMMYWGMGLTLLCMQLAYYPSLFGIKIPEFLAELILLCMILILIGVAVGGYLYFTSKQTARDQQVWIDKNNVYMRCEKKVKRSTHTYTYRIKNIEQAQLENRFIRVKGNIQFTEEVNNNLTHGSVNELLIPRCFTNEERVVKVLRIA